MRLAFGIARLSLLSMALISIVIPSSIYQSVFGQSPPASNQIKIEITSPTLVHAVAGQIITINGTLTNLGPCSVGGIAYISIVDVKDEVPIDLEDWSAHKGIVISSIDSGQSIPMEWKVRLVKDGSYTIVILFSSNNDSMPPTDSSKTFLEVAPKNSLNPSNVLPVAFGVPVLLLVILGAINYNRGRKMGVYS